MRGNKQLKVIFIGLVFIGCLMVVQTHAQTAINSPYTRFGLGWIVDNRFETRLASMGGISIGMQDIDLVNAANPASYMGFDSVSFIIQAGLFGTTVNLRTDDLSENGNYISFSHLIFGFQVTKWWKTSMGVLPYSYVGYNVYAESEEEDIGEVKYVYQGSGGLNQFYWGNAFRVYKGFSVGFNMAYVFGKIHRDRAVGFIDEVYVKNTRIETSFTAKDIYFDFGAQYKHDFKNRQALVVGATYGHESRISSDANYFAATYFGGIETPPLYVDTIGFFPKVSGDFVIPTSIGVGVSFKREDRWLVGADFNWQNWENFELFGRSDSLVNTWGAAIGGEIIPDRYSINSYFQRMTYRFGFRYKKNSVNFRDTDINEFGITFGLGFPLNRSRSTLNMSIEAGRNGTTVNGLIQENYLRFTFSVNIFERWFVKSKYF